MPFFGKPAPPDELRFVLIGKTGSGKSRVGNTLLGKNAFVFASDSRSCTKECTLMSNKRCKRKIDVVDTPGVFDTEKDNITIQKEISRCIAMTTPGPHAFLFCVKMGRITDQEVDVIEHFIDYFGNRILDYMVFIFTHFDIWKQDYEDRNVCVPAEADYIKSLPKKPKSYLEKCNQRYICLGNRASITEKEETVDKLISIVEEMVSKNNNACYTDENYAEAEAILQSMMNVDSIRDVLKKSPSFLEKMQLHLKLFFNKLYLMFKGVKVPDEKPDTDNQTRDQTCRKLSPRK